MVLIVNTTSDTSVTDTIRSEIEKRSAKAATATSPTTTPEATTPTAASPTPDIEIIEAASLNISHCIGCNYCWLKTPGVCTIKDDYEIILKKVVHADQLWVISDTALGFLDHKGKNIFDRILPIATMYLRFKGDQMRHIPRYDQRTDIGIIYRGDAEKDYLKRWTGRAALNFESRSLGVFESNEAKETVSCMCL